MSFYIKKDEFEIELKKSLEQDQLTPKCVEYFQKIAKGLARRLQYKNPQDKEDCINEGLYNVLKYWKNYNFNHPKNNPFSYFTQLIKCGMAIGFKRLNGNGGNRIVTVSINETFNF